MSSLAEQIRSRHEESEGKSSGSSSGSTAFSNFPSLSESQKLRADAVNDVNGEDGFAAAVGAFGETEGQQQQQSSTSVATLNLSDLPQLKRYNNAKPSSKPNVPPVKWGAMMQSSSPVPSPTNGGFSTTPSGSLGGPRIATSKDFTLTATLEVPDEKSAVLQAVRDVSKELNVRIEVARSATPNHATFMIKGASGDRLASARQALEASLQPRQTAEVAIPSTARAAVIGPKGTNLRSLENAHKVNIELSGNKPVLPRWSLEHTLVTIEGGAAAIAAAGTAISKLIDGQRQHSSTRKLSLDELQFLRFSSQWSPYVHETRQNITLHGTFDELVADMREVEALLERVQKTYKRVSFRGNANGGDAHVPAEMLRDIYDRTNSVVLLESSEAWGPPDTVKTAANEMSKFLETQTHSRLDIALAHGRDISHARMLARFFAATGEVERIAADIDGVFVNPEPMIDANSVVYEFVGNERAVNKAKVALKNSVNAHSPTSMCVIRGMSHPVVRKQATKSLRLLKGPIVGIIGPSDELYLEYREPEDDFALSEDDVAKQIAVARDQLAPLADLAKSLVRKKVSLSELDSRFALKPMGPQATELWNEVIGNRDDIDIAIEPTAAIASNSNGGTLNGGSTPNGGGSSRSSSVPVADASGAESSDTESPAPAPSSTRSNGNNSAHGANNGPHGSSSSKKFVIVTLNGTKDAVAAAVETLPKIIQLSKQHAIRASHIEELNVDPELVRNLIGRNGSQIQKFREDHDVKVDIDEAGHVRIQGVEAQVRACAKEIAEFQRRLRDEVTERLDIPVEFHAKLIGPRGKHVRRLSEQHHCLIKFPKSRGDGAESIASSSNGDEESASVVSSTTSESPSTIVIRGPSKGVSAIKREFLDLVNYERERSYMETFKVPSAVVSRLVGRGGVTINAIRQRTGAQIDLGTAQDGEEEVEVVVRGEQRAVKSAANEIRLSADAALDFVEKTVEVDPKFHKFLTGMQNSKRREIVSAAGGDADNAMRILAVPPSNSSAPDNRIVRISGPSAVVAKIEEAIQQIVQDNVRKSQATGELLVPRSRLRRVVGSEGSKVREIEDKFNAIVEIPRGRGPDDELVPVRVLAATESTVADAIDYIREVALPEITIVKVRKGAWSPKVRQQLSSKFHAFATTAAAAEDCRESAKRPADGSNFAALTSPEIDVQIASKNAEESAKVAEFLQQYDKLDTVGLLWVDASKLSTVVGPGGKTIKKIRADTDCLIEVPHSPKGEEQVITITGPRENVEAARDAILQVIA